MLFVIISSLKGEFRTYAVYQINNNDKKIQIYGQIDVLWQEFCEVIIIFLL